MLIFQLALRFVMARKRPMVMSLMGIVFGIGFFVLTQAQTSGFEKFFIRTILGTNGALRISDRFQDTVGLVQGVDQDGRTLFYFESREGAVFREGIDHPNEMIHALKKFPNLKALSEVLEGQARLSTGTREATVSLLGIRVLDHLKVSDLGNQLIRGSIEEFRSDQSGALIGSRLFDRLQLKVGDRITLSCPEGLIKARVSGVFETGVSQIDKNRVYLQLAAARSFFARRFGSTWMQASLDDPTSAPEVASHMQSHLNHRVVSWQEREKVWLDVFKALRFSSAISVSSILLLSGLGIFNVFALMVMEKTRDIAIMRSIGFSASDISKVFLWQGAMVLSVGITLGFLFGACATYLVTKIPLRIRGIFSTDGFVVNWDIWHYCWAASLSILFVAIATWIPARRASRIEPAKVIRETA